MAKGHICARTFGFKRILATDDFSPVLRVFKSRSMITVFILLAVLGLLLSLLFTPLTVVVDTRKALYVLRLHGFCTCTLLTEGGQLTAQIKFPFYHRDIDLLQTMMQVATSPDIRKKPKDLTRNKPDSVIKMSKVQAINILKTFQVKEFYLNMDFGHMMLNGMLYPLFYQFQLRGYRVYVNFLNQRDLTLLIQNRLAKILWAIFSKS